MQMTERGAKCKRELMLHKAPTPSFLFWFCSFSERVGMEREMRVSLCVPVRELMRESVSESL